MVQVFAVERVYEATELTGVNYQAYGCILWTKRGSVGIPE